MNSKEQVALVWFRQDLRLDDNPALSFAHQSGYSILPIYILDDDNSKDWRMGEASRWWLNESLKKLNKDLRNHLCFAKGDPIDIFKDLINKLNVKNIYWNRCYEPYAIKRDTQIKQSLKEKNIEVLSFNGSLLFEPNQVLKEDKTPYKVFTYFYKNGCLKSEFEPRVPIKKPSELNLFSHSINSLDDLNLLPKINWFKQIKKNWQPGEIGANKKLNQFLKKGIFDYKKGRDYPSKQNNSYLSAHLHFGEISPNTIYYKILNIDDNNLNLEDKNHFLSELGWREFSYYLLYHFPNLPNENFQKKFNHFVWLKNNNHLRAWQKGQTGYPIIDAGMRELWQTGYMHNRIRMVVASFLVKNLLISWQDGAKWFWNTLVDADLANNYASWQWVAGSGADAAPYFRIFNPILQSEKFDSKGEYIKKYIPELKNLDSKYIHTPWLAPAEALKKAGVQLGENYPFPIVDLKVTRQRALDVYKNLKVN